MHDAIKYFDFILQVGFHNLYARMKSQENKSVTFM